MKKFRILSVILAAAMLFGLLPLQVFAADTVGTVAISGFEIPPVGALAGEYTATTTLPDNCGYYVSIEYWYCDSDSLRMIDSDTFEPGKVYSHYWEISAEDGFVFDGDTAATVNGGTEYIDANFTGFLSSGRYSVWTVPTKPVNGDAIRITGFCMPVTGQTAGENLSFLGVISYADYEIGDAWWTCVTDNRDMTPEYAFEAGKTYYLNILIYPTGDAWFDEAIPVFINNGTELADPEYTEFLGSEVYIVTSELPSSVRITEVGITGFLEPEEDQTVTENVSLLTVPENGGYKIESIFWFENGERLMGSDDAFENGNSYYMVVYLGHKEGFIFDENNLPSVTINGSGSLAYYADTFTDSSGYTGLTVYSAFFYIGQIISEISLDGCVWPTVGMTADEADFATVIPDGALYTVSSARWRNDTDECFMEPDGVFEAGKTYSYYWGLTATDAIFSGSASVLINGGTGLVDFGSTGVSYTDEKYFSVWTVSAEPLAENVITGVDIEFNVPLAGDSLINSMIKGMMKVDPDAPYTSSASVWNSGTGARMGLSDVFEEGGDYYIVFDIVPDEGYSFARIFSPCS